jgi:hypothetical protein
MPPYMGSGAIKGNKSSFIPNLEIYQASADTIITI